MLTCPRRRSSGALLGVALACALGCGAADPEPVPVPPPLAPPPATARSLDPDEVVALATQAGDPEEAIRRLDRHPFAFELDAEALQRLEPQVPAPVRDYLRKRAQVDWGALRGDVNPETPR